MTTTQGTYTPDSDAPCTRPPEGWHCTRGWHEDGPCAAIPSGIPARGIEARIRREVRAEMTAESTGERARTLADLREDPDFLRAELNAADATIRHHEKRWGQQSQRIGAARAELARERLTHRETMKALIRTEGDLEAVTELTNQRLALLVRFVDLYHDAQKGTAIRDRFRTLVEDTLPHLPAVILAQTDESN